MANKVVIATMEIAATLDTSLTALTVPGGAFVTVEFFPSDISIEGIEKHPPAPPSPVTLTLALSDTPAGT